MTSAATSSAPSPPVGGAREGVRWRSRRGRKVVLPLLGSRPSETLLATTANLCARLDACLEIMAKGVASPEVAGVMKSLRQVGIDCRLVLPDALHWETVVNHVRATPQVTCVVIDSPARWGLDKGPGPPGRALPCPLVVVGEKRPR